MKYFIIACGLISLASATAIPRAQGQINVANDDDKKPPSPPYASGSITSTGRATGSVTSTVYAAGSDTSTASSSSSPAIETASSWTSSVTQTGSSSSAVGTIPPTELVKLIAPLTKQVEQIEAELRQAKGQLRKLDPNNLLAMGGAEEDESKEESQQSEEKPTTDRRRAVPDDEEAVEKDGEELNDVLHNLKHAKIFIPHSNPQDSEEIVDNFLDPSDAIADWNSKPQYTKRQFPPGPAPKFDTASGQTAATLSPRITKLTEELNVAKSLLQANRTTQKHQNEHPMEAEEALGYGQGTTMTPVRPKQPQKQEQAAQGATVVGVGHKKAAGEIRKKRPRRRRRRREWLSGS